MFFHRPSGVMSVSKYDRKPFLGVVGVWYHFDLSYSISWEVRAASETKNVCERRYFRQNLCQAPKVGFTVQSDSDYDLMS